MSEVHPTLAHMPEEGPLLSFAAYSEQVRTAAERWQFDARLGLEVDFIPDKNELIQRFVQGREWDFLIGSVHDVDGKIYELDLKPNREQGEALWLRYFELLRAAVSSGYFSLVSHPVRMRVQNPYVPATLDTELEQLATEAARCNVALELNGFDVLHYPSLVLRLAKACALHQTPVSVGSDAHDPKGVAQAHQQTQEILQIVGISKVRIWKKMDAEEYTL